MRIFYLFCFFNTVIIGQVQASDLPKSLPPGCDTLITMEGNIYLVQIKSQNDQEIRYIRCDQSEGEYAMRRDNIRELKPYRAPMVPKKIALPPPPQPVPLPPPPQPVPPQPPPKPKIEPPVRDTFDLLTLTSGQRYQVLILERDYYNTYYRLYNTPLDDREYCVPNQQVRSLRMGGSHRNYKQTSMKTILFVALGALLLLLLTF